MKPCMSTSMRPPTVKTVSQDITSITERLEAFEDRVGLRLEGLYARFDRESEQVEVTGEAHATAGMELESSVQLVVSVYDAQGRVISTSSTYVDSDSFFGFEVFDITAFNVSLKPARVRIFPKKA